MERFSPTAEEMAMQFQTEAQFVASIYMDLDRTVTTDPSDDGDADELAQARRLRRRSARLREVA
ncbi:MAG: hypothetical protein E6I33_08965 [Chloroflexi bacterium]|nr:MAG: hypothetical protein E6I33_08965 [Chloroflexota bacterium]